MHFGILITLRRFVLQSNTSIWFAFEPQCTLHRYSSNAFWDSPFRQTRSLKKLNFPQLILWVFFWFFLLLLLWQRYCIRCTKSQNYVFYILSTNSINHLIQKKMRYWISLMFCLMYWGKNSFAFIQWAVHCSVVLLMPKEMNYNTA